MVTVEEFAMVPLAISPVISVMVTVNLWLLGNIFILLIKMQSLIFLVRPESSAKIMSDLLRASLGFTISTTLSLDIMLVIPKHTLISPNLIKLPLRKATFLCLQLLPVIAKGNKQVMKTLMIFNEVLPTLLWFSIQLVPLTLEELFPFSMPLNMHQ